MSDRVPAGDGSFGAPSWWAPFKAVNPEVVGRLPEREHLRSLLDGARGGSSGVLVVQGEAGIGKTTLLQDTVGAATDFRVLAIAGVEAELALGFAALHRLLRPALSHIDRLPPGQRRAIEGVFGLADVVVDGFLVGLATLTLLASIAVEQPLLCVIDDAQWLDRESVEVLSFVGRRLEAERLVLLFGMRVSLDGRPEVPAGLAVIHLGGLDPAHAGQLLRRRVTGPIDEGLVQRLIKDTGGSPPGKLRKTAG